MPVLDVPRFVTAAGDGSNTEWPFTFKVMNDTEIFVILREVATGVEILVDSADYAVELNNDLLGGTVTYPLSGSPVAGTHSVVVYSDTARTQLSNISNQNSFYPETVMDMVDKLTILAQENHAAGKRSVKSPVGVTAPTLLVGPEGSVPMVDAEGNLTQHITGASINSAGASAAAALLDADRAEDARDEAVLYGGIRVALFEDLAGLTSSQLAVGDYVVTIMNGNVYKRVTTGAMLDYTGTGGIKLIPMADRAGKYQATAAGMALSALVDDAPAVQMIGQWLVNKGGGTLVLPAAKMLFNTPCLITMPNYNAVSHNGLETLTIEGSQSASIIYIGAALTEDYALTVVKAYSRQNIHAEGFTFAPLALVATGAPNHGAMHFASTWDSSKGGWGVQHRFQCSIDKCHITNETVDGSTGYITNGFRIDWAFHPKVRNCSVKTQSPWGKLDKYFGKGYGVAFYNCYLGELQACHVNGGWKRSAYCYGDQNAGEVNTQDFEGFKVWFCTFDGSPEWCIELDHTQQAYREIAPKEVGCEIAFNHIDGARGGLIISHHKDMRIAFNKFYQQFAERGDTYDFGIDRAITLNACQDTTITGNCYVQGGWWRGTNLVYGTNLATRTTGTSGGFQNEIVDRDSVVTVSFVTPSASPSATPGQVIFETGGTSLGVSLILQNDMTLALYAGTGRTTPLLTTAEPIALSENYTVFIEFDQTNEAIRLHYKRTDSRDYFYRERKPEALLEGFTQTTLAGSDGCGVGVTNGALGGFTGTISGSTNFAGTFTSNLDVYAVGDGSSECIFLDSDCREILIQGERFGTEGVGIHCRSDGVNTIKIGANSWGEQFTSNLDAVRVPQTRYLILHPDAVVNRDQVQVKSYLATANTLVNGDQYREVTVANAAANTLTIPTNAAQPFPIGAVVPILRTGVGATTVAAASGVLLQGVTAGSAVITARFNKVYLQKVNDDSWVISGDHDAVV